jgi:hypothetical protein
MRIHKLLGAALVAATTTIASSAAADGLAASPADVPAAQRTALKTQIDAYRQSNPEAFDAITNLQGIRPEVYGRFRNPIPLVGRELRRKGKTVLLPMLDALVFQAPNMPLSARERRALEVGMLEAVGSLRDARSSAPLAAVFKRHGDAAVSHRAAVSTAAARALGQLCDAPALATLQGGLGDARRAAAIEGLGQCRRLEAAQRLAAELDAASNAAEATRIADALGKLGSSWAWQAKGKSARATGLKVREVVSSALVRNLGRHVGTARKASLRGLSMASHPDIATIAQRHRGSLDRSAAQQLDGVVARIAKRTR